MTEEAEPVLTFGNYRKGQRIQVDIHDPTVRGLIKAKYLKIHWKESGDARTLDSPVDPAGSDSVSAGGVDPDVAGDLQDAEEVDDGQGEHRPEQKDPDSAQAGRSSPQAHR